MRALLVTAVLLAGCSPRLVFQEQISPEERLKLADLVFIGVIQKHHLESWLPFQFIHPKGDLWGVVRSEVMVEHVLRGTESRTKVDVFEIEWMGGRNGDWNTTHDGGRYLFLVRRENRRYHVVGDYWRSIYPITSGRHGRLPLDESHSLWERIALMNWWLNPDADIVGIDYSDPAEALGLWRRIKLARGMMRHPTSAVRVGACSYLLGNLDMGQDECWDALTTNEREKIASYRMSISADIGVTRESRAYFNVGQWWTRHRHVEERRNATAINDRRLRQEFCRLWEREYADDHDNGCPADGPPPATFVTERGDVPLIGRWPGTK
jgi:hypothetical protein